MSDVYDLAVVGAGLMGSATAWAAARRGLRVVVLEQATPGHSGGSSSGSARILRRAYPDPLYARLTGEAFDLWDQLEDESRTRLVRLVGGIDHGGRRNPARIAATLTDAGVPCELLSDRDAMARWPGFRFEGPVLFHPQAGSLDAAGAVTAFLSAARARGARVETGTPVTAISPARDGVTLGTVTEPVRARRAVIAAGGWLPGLVGELVPLPALTVYQQQIFHFARRGLAADAPVVIHKADIETYSLPGGRDGGPGDARKIAEHDWGVPTTATTRDGVVLAASRERITDYVRAWLPGLDPHPFAEATCLYTNTASEDFLLDRVGPLVLCSPCSGHGAKFAPLIGELAADLAQDLAPREQRFTLEAHLAAVPA